MCGSCACIPLSILQIDARYSQWIKPVDAELNEVPGSPVRTLEVLKMLIIALIDANTLRCLGSYVSVATHNNGQ